MCKEAVLARQQTALSHLNPGEVLEKVASFSESHFLLQQSLALLNDLGHHNYITQAHSFLGSSDMHLGRYQEARDHAETGLALAREYCLRYSVGLNLLLLGCLDLTEGAHARAHHHLQNSIAVHQDIGLRADLSWGFAVLALAALGLEDTGEARQYLCHAFQVAIESEAVPPLLWALPAMALLLADQGEVARAVELYALASCYPFVAKSCWFEDVVGQQIRATAATLPSEVAAEARKRGRSCDL